MRRSFLAALSLLALQAATPALAADLAAPSFEPAPPLYIDEGFVWSGFYAGATAGYGFSNDRKAKTTGTVNFLGLTSDNVPSSLDLDEKGVTGGLTLGYNKQFGSFLVGIETDLNYVGQKKTGTFSGAAIDSIAPEGLTTSATQELTWLGTLRGRAGYVVSNPILLYATGGLALGQVKNSAGIVAGGTAFEWSGSTDKVKIGWTIGAGAEYAFSRSITLKAEFLYYNLGKQKTQALGNEAVRSEALLDGVDYTNEIATKGALVRVGLNYRF